MTAVPTPKPPVTLAYVLDPRFPGGTSSAVAAELEVVSALAQVRVYGVGTQMFTGREIAPQLDDALRRLNLTLDWDASEIAADVVIFHNPSCLKFQDAIDLRILARHLIVVTHENFLRPGGAVGFDAQKCLRILRDTSIVLQRSLAPISAWNRRTVEDWLQQHPQVTEWSVLPQDWFNICAFELVPPREDPEDRRGRHSRPGFEKFPGRETMEICFPETAVRNVILGADTLLREPDAPIHWTLHPFGTLSLTQFFYEIDFMVYFTAPTWRESFGRVIAEAIAAGKVVITDPDTAKTFDGAAIAARPEEVEGIIAGYLADPSTYVADVTAAQEKLQRFSAAAFEERFHHILSDAEGCAA